MRDLLLAAVAIFILVKLEQRRQAGNSQAAQTPGFTGRKGTVGGSERSVDRGNGGTAASASFNPIGKGRLNGISGY